MKFRHMMAALCLGALAFGAGPASANDASGGPAAGVGHETSYVTTQGRGVRRGGGGRAFVVAPRRRGNVGRNIAIGVGAAVVGGIIANEVYRSRGGNSCSRWNYQCNRGAGWACRNLDRYC